MKWGSYTDQEKVPGSLRKARKNLESVQANSLGKYIKMFRILIHIANKSTNQRKPPKI